MQCHITSALQMSVRDFRVLRALEAVLNKKNGARLNDQMVIEEAAAFLDKMRPGIQPAYTEEIVARSRQKLVGLGLVRERNVELTGCGKKIIEMTMESDDSRFENHQKWYSAERVHTQVATSEPARATLAA